MVKRIIRRGESRNHLIGAWSFLIGVIIAVVFGIFSSQLGGGTQNGLIGLLLIAGILIGLLHIGNKDSSHFLLAALALVIVSFMGENVVSALDNVLLIGPILRDTLNALLFLFIPTTIIVALKSVFEIAGK